MPHVEKAVYTNLCCSEATVWRVPCFIFFLIKIRHSFTFHTQKCMYSGDVHTSE